MDVEFPEGGLSPVAPLTIEGIFPVSEKLTLFLDFFLIDFSPRLPHA